MKTTVTCPICGGNLIDKALISQFEQSIKTDLEDEYQRKQNDLSTKLEKERVEIRMQVQNESRLQIREKDKLVSDLKEQLFKVTQKLENSSSSQKLVGNVQEEELAEILSSTFSTDIIERVGVGKPGGDCIQYIRSKEGVVLGTILWESKRVKTFPEDKFISKLKKDNLLSGCSLMVICSSTLDKNAPGKIYLKDGVWICLFEPEIIKQLALILRYGIIKVFESRQNQSLSKTQSEKLFQYVSSDEFKRLFENIMLNFKALDNGFLEEKKRLLAYWSNRQTQLQEMLSNVLELHGSISPEIYSISTLDDFKQAS